MSEPKCETEHFQGGKMTFELEGADSMERQVSFMDNIIRELKEDYWELHKMNIDTENENKKLRDIIESLGAAEKLEELRNEI